MGKHKWALLWVAILIVLSPFFVGHSQESQPTLVLPDTLPSNTDPVTNLSEKSKTRLDEIEEDLLPLQKRIADGNKSLEQEAANVPVFLEIQDIALEEFRPYLNRWKLMLDSYHYVLNEVENQINEVSQIRSRLHSRLQLWKLKESDTKLMLSQTPRNPDLSSQLDDIRKTIDLLEDQSDHADDIMASLGKAKTALSQALETCIQNYTLLEKRWEKVRFSRLKWKDQPHFSAESLNYTFQEVQYRLRNIDYYLKGFADYFRLVYENIRQNLTRFSFCVLIALGLGFMLFKWGLRQNHSEPKDTLLGKFSHRLGAAVFKSLPLLLLILLQSILLAGFENIRNASGFWILSGLMGLWLAWFFLQCSRILFINQRTRPRLIPISDKTARSIHRHFSILIWLVLLFSFLNFSSYILQYDSEASRTLEWFFEILIFIVLLSLVRPSWVGILIDRSSHKNLLQPFRQGARILVFFVLALVFSLDSLGYTYLSDYLADATLKSMGAILLMILLKNSLAEWVENTLNKRLFSKFDIPSHVLREWTQTFRLWTQIGLWILFIYTLCQIWDVMPEFNALLVKIWNAGLSVGPVKMTMGLLLSVLITFYIATLLSHFIQFLLEENLYPRKNWDPGIQQACSTGVRYILILIALLISLRILGFDLQNITVLAGALGVGLGFGLQNIANNFASGIILLIERPIKVDDMIQVNGITGRVKKIGARSTVIETADKASILIPNGELLAGQLTNWTYGNSVAGFAIPVGVAYGTDVEKVKELLFQIGSSHPHVLKDPAPRVEFREFGDSSLNFVLRVWIVDVGEKIDVQTDLMTRINQVFTENKIDIPFPQRVVRLEKED